MTGLAKKPLSLRLKMVTAQTSYPPALSHVVTLFPQCLHSLLRTIRPPQAGRL